MVGKRSKGLLLKGPKGLLGVSGVQLMSNTFLIKISSMAHHLTVFFGGESIFEDLFDFFQLLGGLMGLLIKPLSMAHKFSIVFCGEYKFKDLF